MTKRLISTVLAVAMALSTATGLSTTAYAETPRVGNQNYYSNQGDLEPSPFVQLPMSAVQAKGWLKEQLLLQKNGLTGEMHDLYEMYKGTNGWRGGSGDGWERGPYYARGLISLAFVLDDAELKEKAMEWIDFSLDTQRENGFFGPLADGDGMSGGWDWWPRMIMIEAIRDYYEYTEYIGAPDERVLPFFEKYFRFQHDRLPDYPVTSWAAARAGDNAEVVLWYYNRVCDPENPEASKWLIEVAQELMKNSHGIFGNYNDWTTIFIDSTVRNHVVNTTQAMKSPAVQFQYTGSERDRNAIREGIFNMGIDHARVDGLANSDEWARDNLPYVGAEACSVVESLMSYGIAMRILGDSWIGDDMEWVAYNNLPACYTPDFTAHNYFQAQSQMMATNGAHEFIHDHGNSSAFAAPAGDACCISNMHMGWPKFIQNMWMATADDGLAVISYGPNKVTAKVADGKTAVFDQATKYPFDGAIALDYEGEAASFPLVLRVPDWCEAPSFQVNGQPAEGTLSGGYFTIDRAWTAGDTVEIDFPMEVRTSTWYNNSTAVERGPLIYTVKVKEDWHTPDPEMNDSRVLKMSPSGVAPTADFPSREVTPASRWNYALVYDENNPASSFEVTVADEIELQPFHTDNAPVVIRATGQVVPEWQLLNNVVPEPPYSPIAENAALQEEIELIPYGCSRLRIVQMPRVGEAQPTVVRKADDAVSKTLDGEPVLEFDNLMVPNAENYQLKIYYTGSGSLRLNINSKYNQTVDFVDGSGPFVLDDLVGLLPTQNDSMLGTTVKAFQFGYGQYNNIRLFGESDVAIDRIEIVPVGKLEKPEITKMETGVNSVKLTTNVSRADGFYRVLYGTESGNYTVSASGFRTNEANLTGLEENTTYYFKLSMLLDGKTVESEEVSATTGGGPGADAPVADFYDDFSDPAASAQKWSPSGTPGVVTFSEGKMSVAADGNIKVVAGDESWTDYAVEATMRTNTDGGADFGVMFRTTNVDESATTNTDAYFGYYVGLMNGAVRFGFGANGWNLVQDTPYNIVSGRDYQLKVVVCGSSIVIYIDGEKVCQFSDNRYTNGRVGVRSWNKAFEVSSFRVRNLTEAEIAEATSIPTEPTDLIYEDLVYSVFEGAQLAYKRASGEMKIEYGAQPGVYDHVVYGINSKFASDKASVTGLENGTTYYLRLSDASGSVFTPEFVLPTGRRPDLTGYDAALQTELAKARGAVQADYTDEAWARLQQSIGYAERVLAMDEPNEMDYDLAKNVLKIGVEETGIETRGVVNSVAALKGIEIGKYLSLNAVSEKLPQEVEITYGDPAVTATAKITSWRCADYDMSAAGAYIFTGILAPSEVYVNSNNLTAQVQVKVLDNVVRYEAEDAVVTAPAFVGEHTASSGGKQVQSIDNENATVTFTVEAPADGEYEMIITTDGHPSFPNASHKYYVNGDVDNAQIVYYPGGTGWFNWRQFSVGITLKEGENTITFTHSGIENSFAQLDCIDLVLPVVDEYATVRYEAEKGVVTAPAGIAGGATSSGGQHVASIDNADATVTFTVNAPIEGPYEMVITADGHTAFPNASHKYYINGDADSAQIVFYPDATTWGDWHQYKVTIQLPKGKNTITFTHSGLDASFAQLDCIDLTPVEVGDKQALQTAYDEALTRKESDYTAESWAGFAGALADAKAVLDKEWAVQSEIDGAKAALGAATAALVEVEELGDVDKSLLEALIAAIDGKYDAERYTEESFAVLTEALEAAQDIVDSKTATQKDVFDAYLALVKARDGLVYAVDTSLLELAIELAQDLLDDENLNLTDESIAALTEAIEEAEALLQSGASQEEINACYESVMRTITEVSEREPVDKSVLEKLLKMAAEVTREKYTTSSLEALDDAVAAAQPVMEDDGATEEQVKASEKALTEALNSLKRKANFAILESAVATAQEIVDKAEDQTALTEVNALLDEAETLLQNDEATQEEIDELAAKLTRAAALVRLAEVVNAAEANLAALKAADYTAESWNALESAVAGLKALEETDELTVELVNAANDVVLAAFDGLDLAGEEKPVDPAPGKPSKGSVSKASDNDYWDSVTEKIGNASEGDTISVKLEDGQMMPATVLDQAKAKGVKLNVEIAGKEHLIVNIATDAAAVYYSGAELIAMAGNEEKAPAVNAPAANSNPETGGEVAATIPNAAPEATVPVEPAAPEAPAVIEPAAPAEAEAPAAQIAPEATESGVPAWAIAVMAIAAIAAVGTGALVIHRRHSGN
ncbi:beta-L-arabinofuranosidase domain-containing protein [Ligaoa zhengdingensis]|uniref:beta-L-arabinofuranosidase domain-containing protein n=2 Tax=Ligaoa zhengdingensis TaxID=2763658 RepID=UPI0031BA88C5